MRILYLSQYFYPEAGATQARAYDMSTNWVEMGHQVTMLAEFPNHPSGIIPASYKGKVYERVDLHGIDVIRVWVKTSPLKNFRSRMLFYLSYMVNAIIAGIFLCHGKYDFIYATSPPLFVGAAALVLSYLRRTPLFFEVRDLWPETAVALGELSNQMAISLATRLEELCYHRATQIITVTQGMQNRLIQRGIPSQKLTTIPNGANIDLFKFSPGDRDHVRHELGLENKFIAIYAGIHGIAQGLGTVLEAAQILRANPQIHFLMIGEGPEKAKLIAEKENFHLDNVSFLPEKLREEIPGYLSASDIALIPLKHSEIFTSTVPSKVFDAWACERPVLVSIDGETRSMVESIQGGIYSPPEDAMSMATSLLQLVNEPTTRDAMGKRGRIYTEENYTRSALAEKLIIHLNSCVK